MTRHAYAAAGKRCPSRGGRGKDFRGNRARVAGPALVVLLAIGGLGIARGAEAPKATLRFVEDAALSGGKIRLSDVAVIESSDTDLKAKLEAMALGPAPRVGQAFTFRPESVRLLLRRDKHLLGVSDKDIAFEGSGSTRVRVESQEIEPSALLQRLTAWIEGEAATTFGAERVEVSFLTKPPKVAVPKGEWTAKPAMNRLPSRLTSILSVPVSVAVDGETFQTLTLALKLRAFATAGVVTRAIHRHETLDADAIDWKELDITTLNGEAPISESQDISGWRATRSLSVGDPLTQQSIESIPIIQKGDPITVYLEAPQLRITMAGEAQQDGRLGDVIRCLNLRSGKMIRGIVAGERLVRIDMRTLQTTAMVP